MRTTDRLLLGTLILKQTKVTENEKESLKPRAFTNFRRTSMFQSCLEQTTRNLLW
jgi:hypothetical protein